MVQQPSKFPRSVLQMTPSHPEVYSLEIINKSYATFSKSVVAENNLW